MSGNPGQTMSAADLGLPERYVLEGRLGDGSLATVYRAYDQATERLVAIKVLSSFAAASPAVRARIRREGRALQDICHPNLVRLYELSGAGDPIYLVLEYIDGQSLDVDISKGRFSPAQAIDVIRQVALGAGALHAAGLVHRDIKPGNVLVSSLDGRAVLADLNLVFSKDYTPLTASGDFMGTLLYLAPEYGRELVATAQSDVFALGLLAFELLAGRPAITIASMHGYLAGGEYPRLPPPEQWPVSLSSELGRILARCLALEPRDRFADANVVARVLDEGLDADDDTEAESLWEGPQPSFARKDCAAKGQPDAEPVEAGRARIVQDAGRAVKARVAVEEPNPARHEHGEPTESERKRRVLTFGRLKALVWCLFLLLVVCWVWLGRGGRNDGDQLPVGTMGGSTRQLRRQIAGLVAKLNEPAATATSAALDELTRALSHDEVAKIYFGQVTAAPRQLAMLMVARSAVESSNQERACYWYEQLLQHVGRSGLVVGGRSVADEFVSWSRSHSRRDGLVPFARILLAKEGVADALPLSLAICDALSAAHRELSRPSRQARDGINAIESAIALLDELLTATSSISVVGDIVERYVDLLSCPGVKDVNKRLLALVDQLSSKGLLVTSTIPTIVHALGSVFDADIVILQRAMQLAVQVERASVSPEEKLRMAAFRAVLLSRMSFFSTEHVEDGEEDSVAAAERLVEQLRQQARRESTALEAYVLVIEAFVSCHANKDTDELERSLVRSEACLKGLQPERLPQATRRWYYFARAEMACDRGSNKEAAAMYQQALELSTLHQRPFVRARLTIHAVLPFIGFDSGY